MNRLKKISSFLAVFGLFLNGCVSNSAGIQQPKEGYNSQLVGLWKADIGFASWVIIRRLDQTFEERRIQIYDYSKPAIRFAATGRWKISDGKYIKEYTSATASIWRSAIGEQLTSKVISISNSQFRYQPDDGPQVIEMKLPEKELNKFTSLKVDIAGPYANHPVE